MGQHVISLQPVKNSKKHRCSIWYKSDGPKVIRNKERGHLGNYRQILFLHEFIPVDWKPIRPSSHETEITQIY